MARAKMFADRVALGMGVLVAGCAASGVDWAAATAALSLSLSLSLSLGRYVGAH